jgi:hypothetical protein
MAIYDYYTKLHLPLEFKIIYIIFLNLIFMTLISTVQRQKLPFWLLISGIILSTLQFMYGRSLWLDEISLSNNILQRDYAALLLPLANNQVAPILFLWVEKSFALLLFCYTQRSAPAR